MGSGLIGEFGGIRRQELGPDIGLRSEERLHDVSPVRLQAIPDQDPRCIPLPIELAEKVADARSAVPTAPSTDRIRR